MPPVLAPGISGLERSASTPNAKTGGHHHGPLESVIYMVRGKARMRWGKHLELVAEAEVGDFIFIPSLFRAGKSMPAPTRRCNACWYAAIMKRWWW